MDRRTFLISLSSAGAAFSLISLAVKFWPTKSSLKSKIAFATAASAGGTASFHVMDFLTGELSHASVKLTGLHGYAQHPKLPDSLLMFEKRMAGGAIASLAEKKVVSYFSASPGRVFYGHGCFANDPHAVYCVEWAQPDGESYLVVRNPADGGKISESRLNLARAHDLVFSPRLGKLLVASRGHVLTIDPTSLAEEARYATADPDIFLDHICEVGDAFVVSGNRRVFAAGKSAPIVPNSPFLLSQGKLGDFISGKFPSLLEQFDVEADVSGEFVGISYPLSKAAAVFSASSREVLKTYEFSSTVSSVNAAPQGGFLFREAGGKVWLSEPGKWELRLLTTAPVSSAHAILI